MQQWYDELEKEGFIVIRQGLGTFVASMNPDVLKDEKQKEIEKNLFAACQIAKAINLSETELIELIHYIYKGDMCDE